MKSIDEQIKCARRMLSHFRATGSYDISEDHALEFNHNEMCMEAIVETLETLRDSRYRVVKYEGDDKACVVW
jgi:ribonuclease HI